MKPQITKMIEDIATIKQHLHELEKSISALPSMSLGELFGGQDNTNTQETRQTSFIPSPALNSGKAKKGYTAGILSILADKDASNGLNYQGIKDAYLQRMGIALTSGQVNSCITYLKEQGKVKSENGLYYGAK